MNEVKQFTLGAYSEGSQVLGAAAKMGIPAMLSKWDHFALGGFMFNTHETTIGTPITGGAVNAGGIVLTAPAIRMTVPTGLTVFPRRLNLAIQTAAGTLNELQVVASDGDTYTSGGAVLTAYNWRMDDLRASGVANLRHCSGAALVEAAISNPRQLWTYTRALAFAAGESYDGLTTVEWDDLVPLVGPCSLLVYLGAAGTALTYTFALDWAEVPSVNV
jgi:hypothetical protein